MESVENLFPPPHEAEYKHIADSVQGLEREIDSEEDIQIQPGFIHYQSDFCFKLAVVVGSFEQTVAEEIRMLMAQLLDSEHTKGIKFISIVMKLNRAVLMSGILKLKMKKVLMGVGETDLSLEELEYECLQIFHKKVGSDEHPAVWEEEYIAIFSKMNIATILKLRNIMHDPFVNEIVESCAFTRENIEHFKDMEDKEYAAKSEIAVKVLLAIGVIKDALAKTVALKQIRILSEPQQKLTKDSVVKLNPTFMRYVDEIYNTQPKEEIVFPVSGQMLRGLRALAVRSVSRPEANMAQRLLDGIQLDSDPLRRGQPEARELLGLVDEPIERETQEKVLILSARFPRTTRIRRCCPTHKPEQLAALYDRFPEVEALNGAMALRLSVQRMLRLYPHAVPIVIPKLFILEFMAGLIAAGFATQAILRPKTHSILFRIWKATSEGAIFFVFYLGVSIDIYRRLHPDQMNMDDEEFWFEIASGPLAFFTGHTIWNLITPLQKEKLFPRDTKWHIVRVGLDFVFKGGLFSGIFKEFLTLFKVPGNIVTQLICLIPGLSAVAGRLTMYKERLTTTMKYIATTIFHIDLIKSFLPGSQEHALESPTVQYLRCGFWLVMLGGSIYLVYSNAIQFVDEYVDEEKAAEIIAQFVRVEVGEENPALIDKTDYKLLEDAFTESDRKQKAENHQSGERKQKAENLQSGERKQKDEEREGTPKPQNQASKDRERELLWMSIAAKKQRAKANEKGDVKPQQQSKPEASQAGTSEPAQVNDARNKRKRFGCVIQ